METEKQCLDCCVFTSLRSLINYLLHHVIEVDDTSAHLMFHCRCKGLSKREMFVDQTSSNIA